MADTKITLEDIAIHAGVSTAAVSQALSGKGALSTQTRERILQVVEEMSYQPDQVARNLAMRRSSKAYGKRLGRSKSSKIPPPGVMVFYDLPELYEVVHLEIQQRLEEGYEVNNFQASLKELARPSKQRLYNLYRQVLSAPLRTDLPFSEPEDLAEIHASRPDGPRNAHLSVTSSSLYERVYGAWLGRIAGCVLGKPVQSGWSRSQVTRYLQLADSYPLVDYIPRVVPPLPGFEFKPEATGSFLGEIEGAHPDDDTDFSVLSLHILETYGLDFKTSDVATEWLGKITYFATYTTERAVYRNLVWNIHPDETATFVNPEREFIGARIRADVFGYIAPGNPELAASLAYRDAALSHTKNGIYSAMFTAAMISWAFVSQDVGEIVQVGLSEVPENCRLALAVRELINTMAEHKDWEVAYDHLLLKYGAYSPIHAINNTLWAVLALINSRGDFDRALGTAVVCGMDTGSNAASVGSIAGVIHGAGNIPVHWIEPLQDRLHSGVAYYSDNRISELARRTAAIAERTLMNIKSNGG
jgi:ADP-ribosylglycohydrolase/transcriptional regulator with XRE-family HTH domain